MKSKIEIPEVLKVKLNHIVDFIKAETGVNVLCFLKWVRLDITIWKKSIILEI